VGTFLAYTNGSVWTWVDGELYLPEDWFTAEKAELREKLGIPAEREFKTKIELGWEMIQRAHANGLPFEAICCDDFYGKSGDFRAEMRAAGFVYMAGVPHNTLVYLKHPIIGVPEAKPGRRGPKPSRSRVLSPDRPLKVSEVAQREDTNWHRVRVRSTERGELNDEFAARRIWTIHEDEPIQEWLVIRRECNGRCTYSLSNASPNTHLKRLAWLKCQRYFVERANQDAKTELGRTGSTEVFGMDAPSRAYHSRYVVHHADKNRVGGAVRSRPRSIAAVRGGSVTGVVHRQCTSSTACCHAVATANA